MNRRLSGQDGWDRLTWSADRVSFIQVLLDVRGARNRLMHFSPDLPTTEEIVQMAPARVLEGRDAVALGLRPLTCSWGTDAWSVAVARVWHDKQSPIDRYR